MRYSAIEDKRFFKTEKDKYVFALLIMDGTSRAEFLGMKKSCYYIPSIAKAWKEKIMDVLLDTNIETDFSAVEVAEAITRVNRFYDNMTEHLKSSESDDSN